MIFCKPSPIEVDKKSKSPPNQNRKNNFDKNSFPLQQRFDESNYFVNSQHEIARRLSETSAEIISKFKNLIDYEKAYENGYEDLYSQEHSYEYVDTNRPTRFQVQKIDESQFQNQDLSELRNQRKIFQIVPFTYYKMIFSISISTTTFFELISILESVK